MEHYFAAITDFPTRRQTELRKTAKIHKNPGNLLSMWRTNVPGSSLLLIPASETSGRFQRKRNGEYIALRLQPVIQQHILRIGGIREQEFPVLGIHHTVQLLWGISDRIQTAHNGPHTSAHHIIYRIPASSITFRAPICRRPFGATPTEYDSHFRTTRTPKGPSAKTTNKP